jgi:succinate dehydrogenase/fumarate reductase flavoprotein subunit
MLYGHFCPGPKGGEPYGARRHVKTMDEAKCMVETSFSSMGEMVKTGKIEEKEWYFTAEILNRDGAVTDVVAVDKRTGRMRSIY